MTGQQGSLENPVLYVYLTFLYVKYKLIDFKGHWNSVQFMIQKRSALSGRIQLYRGRVKGGVHTQSQVVFRLPTDDEKKRREG